MSFSFSAMASNYQLGCTDSGCSSVYVPDGYQLGCPREATSCTAIYVPPGYQLGCTKTSCSAVYVP
ncbi:MAG: hypothetical protein ACXVCN_10230 [Bdellovibrio sp.]